MGRIPVIVVLVAASLVFVGAVALAQEDGQYEATQYAAEPPAATTSDEATQYATEAALPPPTTPDAGN